MGDLPGQRRLELPELAARVLEQKPELGDQRFEALLAWHAPGRVAQAEPTSLATARPRLHVAQVQHVLDVHQRVGERRSDDGAPLVAPHRRDAGFPAVGLVLVESHHDLGQDRAELDRGALRPQEGHAILRDVDELATLALALEIELDGDPHRAELRGLVAIGTEVDVAAATALQRLVVGNDAGRAGERLTPVARGLAVARDMDLGGLGGGLHWDHLLERSAARRSVSLAPCFTRDPSNACGWCASQDCARHEDLPRTSRARNACASHFYNFRG